MNETQNNSNQALQVFNSPQFGQIRTSGTSEQPLFCLTDVCKVLDLQVSATKNRLNQDGVNLIKVIDTMGREQIATFVNEANLYKLIMRSNKPQAEAFQDWVCGEVLPTIRKNGAYVAAQPEETPEILMARALKAADAAIKRQQAQLEAAQNTIAIQQPKADYFDNVLQSNTTYNLTEISKDLGFQSVHKFCEWARMHGIIYKQSNGVHKEWMPTSRWSGKGWFATRTSQFLHKDGTIGSTMQTVVTESGRVQLHIFQTRTTKTA